MYGWEKLCKKWTPSASISSAFWHCFFWRLPLPCFDIVFFANGLRFQCNFKVTSYHHIRSCARNGRPLLLLVLLSGIVFWRLPLLCLGIVYFANGLRFQGNQAISLTILRQCHIITLDVLQIMGALCFY